MKKTVIFDEMELEYPNDLVIMDKEELNKKFSGSENRWAVKNQEKHMIISVVKLNPNAIMGFLTDEKSVANGIKIRIKKNMQDYHEIGTIKTNVDGRKACGFVYDYLVKDTDVRQYSEVLVISLKRRFYVVQYYSQLESNNDNINIYHNFLNSVRFR